MKNLLSFFLLWCGFLLQSTVFQIEPFNVVHPNFVLIILVVIAVVRGAKVALVCGILIGVVQDVSFGTFIGLNAFAYGVVGYFSAAAFSQFLHKNVAITFLVTVISSFALVWITFGLTRLFDVTAFSWEFVMSDALAQMMENGLLLLPLYAPLKKLMSSKPKGRYKTNENETSTH